MNRMKLGGLAAALALGTTLTLGISPANAIDIPPGSSVGAFTHVKNGRSGLCLAVPGGSHGAAVQVNQFTCGNWNDHYWQLTLEFSTPQGAGWYSIRNFNSGQCLSVDAARQDENAPVTQYPCGSPAPYVDQYWHPAGVAMTENGRVVEGWILVNYNSRKCVGIQGGSSANTAPAVQVDCDSGGASTLWQ
ncbi:RICIN domain-containing protein [Streptomyces sp. NPDC002773]|uniref:RICIN domain-containing protein n=1 Tax=Streptomyces sp. NPDC002773 TaxID=3154430 RepID=UPI003318546B